ncbi:hypothetical protein CHU94_14470 [Rhodoferax sp. TH121]|uniref:hypothetical protein n=1 Tax=Rhodoferax sp. TH121 TaxID=2022803 RepID=UPI000B9627CB|nr:hypothetical protein [Rhodoferax sp. TH121]OYQ38653.1 hypothetical protein CHU94_14470 [Rhodoferax sp. TH121]
MNNPDYPKNAPIKHGYFYYLGVGTPIPLFIIVGVMTLWAIYHAATTRTAAEYLRYGWIFGIPLMLAVGNLWFSTWRKSKQIKVWLRILMLVHLIAGAAIGGALYYSLVASAYDFLRWLIQQWDRPYSGPLLVGMAVFLIGLVLFLFRVRYRATYGLTEVAAGISIATYKYIEVSTGTHSAAPTDPNLLIALLTAGVYLVVRGLDNMQQGLSATPADRLLQPLATWYKTLGMVVEVKELDTLDQDPYKKDSS